MYFHMGKAHTHAIFSLAILLACCACAFALDPSLDISQYAHTSWKIRDGFPKGVVYSVAQTPDGYLWLGTEFGLVRFDGVRGVEWQPGSGRQLPSDWIRSLFVSRDATLWIGTQKGLARWKDGKLTTYADLSGQYIASFLQEGDGTVWVGTIDGISGGRLCAIRDGSTHCSGGDGSLGLGVLSLFGDHNGGVWVGVQNGVWRWKPGRSEFFPVPEADDAVRFFGEDERGLLLGTKTGIKRLVVNRVEPYFLGGVAQPIAVTRLLRDHNGGLWVGTLDRGLLHVHNGRTDTFSQTDGLSGNDVISLYEDREGNVWVATSNGLDRFREYAVPNISIAQGLSSAVTYSVLPANDGSIWISTVNGLNRWKNGHVSVLRAQPGNTQSAGIPGTSAFTSLFKDSRGRVWAAGSHGFAYLEKDKLVSIRDFPKIAPFGIAELGLGHIWLAHQFAGILHVFQGKVVQQIPWAGVGRKDFATALTADPSRKGLWLGFATGGIAYFADGGIRKAYSAEDGLGAGRVANLRFGPRGALWAATQGGLSRIEDGRIATLTIKNGLPCDTIHWSIEGDDHSMWLYMACGLVRIERSELDRWMADTTRQVKTTVFGIAEGVTSHVAGGLYEGAAAKSPDGRLWFTTFDGVSIIDPHNLHENKLPPPVHIEQITADDKPHDAQNSLRLPARVRNLDIDYTAPSLVVPEKVRFRVKLEGQDKDWRELVNVRHVEYTNLAPRTYRFRVMACNNSGVWNEEGATLDFVIPPAWYQTTWFRMACVAAFLAMIWGTYQLRVRQLASQFNMRLEERVHERTRIARELHDTLLQSFHGLLMRFQTASRLLPGRPAEAKEKLDGAIEQAEEAIIEGREAVQNLRTSTVQRNDLAQAISMLGEELATDSTNLPSPIFRVAVEGAPQDLHPILRDEVYRITAEALRNAFRHAQARQIEVEIRYDSQQFRLRMRDDGRGFNPNVPAGQGRKGHYGLPGMRERAKIAGGKLKVWSEVGAGTEVELEIPATIAYLTTPSRSWLSEKLAGKAEEMK